MLPQMIIARAAMASSRPDLASHAAMNCALRRWVANCAAAMRRLTTRRDASDTAARDDQ